MQNKGVQESRIQVKIINYQLSFKIDKNIKNRFEMLNVNFAIYNEKVILNPQTPSAMADSSEAKNSRLEFGFYIYDTLPFFVFGFSSDINDFMFSILCLISLKLGFCA